MGMCSALELTTQTVKLWKLWKSTLKMKVCLPFPLICCHHKASTDPGHVTDYTESKLELLHRMTQTHTNRHKDTDTHTFTDAKTHRYVNSFFFLREGLM